MKKPKYFKIFYFDGEVMKYQTINDAKDKEDAKRIAKEKYGIVALRVEKV